MKYQSRPPCRGIIECCIYEPVLALSGLASLDVSLNSCTAGSWMRPKQRLPQVRPIQEFLKGGHIRQYKGDIHGIFKEDTRSLDYSSYASLLSMGRGVDGAPMPLLMGECIVFTALPKIIPEGLTMGPWCVGIDFLGSAGECTNVVSDCGDDK